MLSEEAIAIHIMFSCATSLIGAQHWRYNSSYLHYQHRQDQGWYGMVIREENDR